MKARENILQSIHSAQVDKQELPEMNFDHDRITDKTTLFKAMAESVGAEVNIITAATLKNELANSVTPNKKVINRIAELGYVHPEIHRHCSYELEDTDLCLIRGQTAVAENGAIWVTEEHMGNRMLPFICKSLVLVITEKDIVWDMHQAYGVIDLANCGYGVFISGPSKTADIEQVLVIGAHGALKTTIYIVEGWE